MKEQQKLDLQLGIVSHTFDPNTQRQRQEDYHKFKTNWGYMESSGKPKLQNKTLSQTSSPKSNQSIQGTAELPVRRPAQQET